MLLLTLALAVLPAVVSGDGVGEAREFVLPELLPGGVPRKDMVQQWLRSRTDAGWELWKSGFEARIDGGGWDERDRRLRAALIDAIGGLPEERTPLRARVTGRLSRPGYRVEKILFESQPRFYVTATLFLPENADASMPAPGVLIPCGHAAPAKGHDEYQAAGALLALNGMAALVFDPVDQGERFQRLDKSGEPIIGGTAAHTQAGMAATLIGWNLIRTMIWDGIRALDYLESRPEVDGARLGITGNSGGGTQGSFIFALDERLSVAAPSCYIHQLHHQAWDAVGDSEQMFFGQLAHGFEHAEFYLSRAPAPVLLLAATHDFFGIEQTWETFRFLQRRYTDLGFSERAAILENNAGHNYNRQQREAMARWMSRWLLRRDHEIREPELNLFAVEELWAAPRGQVLLLEDARSIWDIYRDESARLAEMRGNPGPDELADRIRRATGVRSTPEGLGTIESTRSFYVVEDGRRVEGLVLTWGEEPLAVPMVVFEPVSRRVGIPVLFATTDPVGRLARDPAPLREWLGAGRTVAVFNPTGLGESRQTAQGDRGEALGLDVKDAFALYQLGESQLKMRTEDVLRAARFLKEHGVAPDGRVELVGDASAGVAALHAGILDPERFPSLILRGTLNSWTDFIRHERSYRILDTIVHGVLRHYDLPDLVAALGDSVRIEVPLNAVGMELLDEGSPLPESYLEPTLSGLHGLYFSDTGFRNPMGAETLYRLEAEWDNRIERRGNDWAGEWSGFLVGPADGMVEFEGASDQQIELLIDGRPIFSRTAFPGSTRSRMEMTEGRLYPVIIRYIQPGGGRGSFSIRWSKPGSEPEVVGSGALRHSRQLESLVRQQLVR